MKDLKERLPELRRLFDARFMTSAVDEYCPEEFGELLDYITQLEAEIAARDELICRAQISGNGLPQSWHDDARALKDQPK